MALERAHSEKRGFIRMRIDTPVQVTHGTERFTARCKDLSGSGMLLATERPVAVGTELEVSIEQDAANRQPFRATATVIRSDPDPEGSHILGLSLISIHE